MFDIKEELKRLPEKPGVYIMKDAGDKIIYVGKAKVLKNRVRQYFQSSHNNSPKVSQMVRSIESFEIIITDNELEALILECNLIKSHKPKYNILLRDDKYYPYIKVTTNEDFPRILAVRSISKDKAKYYGPFSSMTAVKETVELCRRIFKLRSCNLNLPKDINKKRPCLYYHIGRCNAPCGGFIAKEEYEAKINSVVLFLDGKQKEILDALKNDMNEASENMEFEKAAEIRDRIAGINQIFEKQKAEAPTDEDRDVIAFARSESEAVVQIFFIRGGKMLGSESFLLLNTDGLSEGALMSEVLKQFYAGGAFIPKEIIIADETDDYDTISEWLNSLRGKKTELINPKKGEKLRLARLAEQNAREALERRLTEIKRDYGRAVGAMKEIQEALSLEKPLNRVEAYDISNIHGFESVGSMVVFENGKPKRSDYRKFKIKTVTGANDYASMHEVILRRFSRGIKEIESSDTTGKFAKLPDIIMTDGGKTQIGAALKALEALSLTIPVCGMVKDDNHRTRGIIFGGEEISMKKTSEGFKLLTRIQDEVHRFSIEYHKKLREIASTKSILDDIEGVGAKRRKAIQAHFVNIDDVKNASYEELCAVPGVDKKTALNVFEFFNKIH